MFRRVFLAAALAVTFVSAASAETVNYAAHLSGAREVPKNDTKGTGSFTASLDTASKVLTYTLTFDGLTGPATMAHLHGPAKRGENAGVLVPLGKDVTSPLSGTATLTDDQIAALTAGKIYVNVHTATNPSGEIRGQVARVTKKKAKAAAKAT